MWMRDFVFRYSLAHYLAAKKLTGQNINAMPRVQSLFGELSRNDFLTKNSLQSLQSLFGELSRNVLRPHTESEKCEKPRKTKGDIAEDRLDSGVVVGVT